MSREDTKEEFLAVGTARKAIFLSALPGLNEGAFDSSACVLSKEDFNLSAGDSPTREQIKQENQQKMGRKCYKWSYKRRNLT